jgi:coenzyme F420-reducing hydrogenase beta subunit
MKYRNCSKLVTYLLVTTFLVASAGTVFGYAWCFGDDGHVEVNYSKGGSCCSEDFESHSVNRYNTPSISQLKLDSCGSCLDFSAQQSDAVFFKRVKRTSVSTVVTFSTNFFSTKVVQSAPCIAKQISSSPRVSPTLLAHRTVVLLN